MACGVMLNTHYIRYCIELSIAFYTSSSPPKEKKTTFEWKKTIKFNAYAIYVRITENSIRWSSFNHELKNHVVNQ